MSATPAIQYKTNIAGFNRSAEHPSFEMPTGACDAHMHIVGPFAQYPLLETGSMQPTEATVSEYRSLMAISGLERAVVVQPSWYAKDCSCTLDAAAAIGPGGRAVVVVEPGVSDATLMAYHNRGARGVRLQNQVAGGTSTAHLLDIAARIQPLGWHIQIFVDTADIVDLAPSIRKSPVPVVIDHMAHLRGEDDLDSVGLRLLFELMNDGPAWVKLSNTRFVPDPKRMKALVAANSNRLVWGSDWPQVAFEGEVPTLGRLLSAFGECVPDEHIRRLILSDNPGKLYFGEQ